MKGRDIINKIVTKKFTNELYYKGNVILTYNIEYPQIQYSEYSLGQQYFNSYNLRKAIEQKKYAEDELFKDAKEVYDYNEQNNYPIMVFELVVKFEITYNVNHVVSLYSDEYIFSGGAHGNTIRTSQNWNLQIGKEIPLKNFFPNNEYYIIDIIKEINKQIAEQMQGEIKPYFDNYCELVLENFDLDNYYVVPNNQIAVYFQQYEIAPYVTGIPVFYIKLT